MSKTNDLWYRGPNVFNVNLMKFNYRQITI